MVYVLRKISPPGRSARADQATAAALAGAAATGTMVYGPYLEWADPDARGGFGDDGWTDDIAKAKRFATFSDAVECWKRQSTVRPIRDDGKPNRPLTAFSVYPQEVDQ